MTYISILTGAARLAIDEVKQAEDTINQIEVDVEILRQELSDIPAKGVNSASTLRLVADTLPSWTYFTSIEVGNEQVIVSGEIDGSFTV